jgi:hypothetical protein
VQGVAVEALWNTRRAPDSDPLASVREPAGSNGHPAIIGKSVCLNRSEFRTPCACFGNAHAPLQCFCLFDNRLPSF